MPTSGYDLKVSFLEYMDYPPGFFRTLTFGELAVGDKFIAMPIPGDNHGHGGFLGTSNVFMKWHAGSLPENRDCRAEDLKSRNHCFFPPGTPVLKLNL